YVYLMWLDYMGTMRCRILHVRDLLHLIKTGKRVGIAQAIIGVLQDDTITSACSSVGQIFLHPEFTSLRACHPKDRLPSASVLCSWYDALGDPFDRCPRSMLGKSLNEMEDIYSIIACLGFEVEVTFLRRTGDEDNPFEPITKNHAWCAMSGDQWSNAMPLVAEIVSALELSALPVLEFHAAPGPGKYDFALRPKPALQAIDALIQTRQIIYQIAELHGIRATLHPAPVPGAASGAHAHISLNGEESSMQMLADNFFAGVIEHLESICAFSMPQAPSYDRVAEDRWTGGVWVAWGTQNRECPLRKVKSNHWEMRCADGTANMYLAIGAVIAAGLEGIDLEKSLTHKDCQEKPHKMTAEERLEHGMTKMLPKSIEQSLQALEKDEQLQARMGPAMVKDYIVMKRQEQEKLKNMPKNEAHVWLVERY
ncbi:glutamine synthetase/guanido kinase, partial [Eremomyces bilateralis CBS 781.70]